MYLGEISLYLPNPVNENIVAKLSIEYGKDIQQGEESTPRCQEGCGPASHYNRIMRIVGRLNG